MSLTDSQKQTVSAWISAGKSLSEVQHLLKETFSISMTYMEIRFLVDDLNIVPQKTNSEDAEESDDKADEKVEEPEVVDDGKHRGVRVDVDAVTPPDALLSGTATLSDGVTMGWQLLSTGQLGLTPEDNNKDYRPSPEDMQDFRTQVSAILRQKGF